MSTNTKCQLPIAVSAELQSLLCEVASGWTPEPFSLGKLKTPMICNIELSDPSIDITGNTLNVVCSQEDSGKLLQPAVYNTLTGTLESGHTIELNEFVEYTGAKNSNGLTIKYGSWKVMDASTPFLWICELDGMPNTGLRGNLSTKTTESNDWNNGFFLSGISDYYLIRQRTSKTYFLLIDTSRAQSLDVESLKIDLRILEFVFGAQLVVNEFLGITQDKRVVARMSGYNPGVLVKTNLRTQPVPYSHEQAWNVVFFEKLSKELSRLRKVNHKLHDHYIASLVTCNASSGYYDDLYALLHIRLEGLASCLMDGKTSEALDVKDLKEWKAFINDIEEKIRGLAKEDRCEAIISKVRQAYKSSSQAVRSAFSEYGLTLGTSMQDSIEDRNVIIHTGVFPTKNIRTGNDIGGKFGTVRTMLVALIAKSVGYQGAICGWNRTDFGWSEPPTEWWAIDEEDRQLAGKTYIAQVLDNP